MAHWYNNPYSKRESGTDTPSHYMVGMQGPDQTQWAWTRPHHTAGGQGPIRQRADRPQWASRDPHPLGHQPGHQGERASVKETSHTQGLQPVHQGCMVITKSNMVLTALTDGRKDLLFNTDMQECQQGVNPTHWEASLAKEREPWWQGSVPPMIRDLGHSPTSDQC